MNIFVNSRMFQSENTGIPNYIDQLYNCLKKIDGHFSYTFLQFDGNKKIRRERTI